MSQLIVPKPVTEVIDGLEFTTLQFPAFYALGLLPRLTKLGPSFGMTTEGQDNSAPLDAATFQNFALELLRQTSVMVNDGKGVLRRVELTSQEKFNQVFAGRFQTVFKVIAFAIKANFETFADGSASETADPQLPAR
jgi:hypothetical protein